MSRVIKAIDWLSTDDVALGSTQAWTPPPTPPSPEELLQRERLRSIGLLKQTIEDRDGELQAGRDGAEIACRQARDEGYAAGLNAGGIRKTEALAVLKGGVDQALLQLDERLLGLERLAILVARDGLERILGKADQQVALLVSALRRQMATIEKRSIIHVEVSDRDFPDEDAFSELIVELGASVQFRRSETLKPGGCRIALRLGEAEVGVAQQWARLRGALDDLAEAEA